MLYHGYGITFRVEGDETIFEVCELDTEGQIIKTVASWFRSVEQAKAWILKARAIAR